MLTAANALFRRFPMVRTRPHQSNVSITAPAIACRCSAYGHRQFLGEVRLASNWQWAAVPSRPIPDRATLKLCSRERCGTFTQLRQ
jgi:hypothetical protein